MLLNPDWCIKYMTSLFLSQQAISSMTRGMYGIDSHCLLFFWTIFGWFLLYFFHYLLQRSTEWEWVAGGDSCTTLLFKPVRKAQTKTQIQKSLMRNSPKCFYFGRKLCVYVGCHCSDEEDMLSGSYLLDKQTLGLSLCIFRHCRVECPPLPPQSWNLQNKEIFYSPREPEKGNYEEHNTVKVKLKQNMEDVAQAGHLYPVLQLWSQLDTVPRVCSIKYYSVWERTGVFLKIQWGRYVREAGCFQLQDPQTHPESGSLPLLYRRTQSNQHLSTANASFRPFTNDQQVHCALQPHSCPTAEQKWRLCCLSSHSYIYISTKRRQTP